MIKTNEFNKELFPMSFIDLLPTVCETCGELTEVSESLTFLQCSNRKCPSKIEYRMYHLFQDIGIHDLSIEDCRGFIERFNITNPYAVFLYNPKFDGLFHLKYDNVKSENLYKKINQRRGMLLWEYVKIGNLISLKDSAETLLDGYTDINIFYKDLEDGGIQFVQKLLMSQDTQTLKNGEILVKAVTLYDTLMYFKEDIIKGIRGVVILKPERVIGVVFASNVSGYISTQEYILYLNSKYRGKIYFYQTNILKNSKEKVIYWEEMTNKKETTQLEIVKDKYPDIKIVNIKNMEEVLKGV